MSAARVALLAVAALLLTPTAPAAADVVQWHRGCVTIDERDTIRPGEWRGHLEDEVGNDLPRLVYATLDLKREAHGYLMAYPACRGGRVYVWYLDTPNQHRGPARVAVRAGGRAAVYEIPPSPRRLARWARISSTSYPAS